MNWVIYNQIGNDIFKDSPVNKQIHSFTTIKDLAFETSGES